MKIGGHVEVLYSSLFDKGFMCSFVILNIYSGLQRPASVSAFPVQNENGARRTTYGDKVRCADIVMPE